MTNDRSVYSRFYDLDAAFEHDLPYYASHAGGQRVLELAAGSGRVLAALGDAAALTGVDLDPAMLALAERRLEACDVPCTLLQGDMRHPPVEGPFDLVILAVNALGLPATPAGQRATLCAIRRVLAPGGKLLIDMPAPATWLAERAPFGVERLVYSRPSPGSDQVVTRYVTHQHEAEHQLILATYRYVVFRPDGSTASYTCQECLRYLFRQELLWLLELTGFKAVVLDHFPGKLTVEATPA